MTWVHKSSHLEKVGLYKTGGARTIVPLWMPWNVLMRVFLPSNYSSLLTAGLQQKPACHIIIEYEATHTYLSLQLILTEFFVNTRIEVSYTIRCSFFLIYKPIWMNPNPLKIIFFLIKIFTINGIWTPRDYNNLYHLLDQNEIYSVMKQLQS